MYIGHAFLLNKNNNVYFIALLKVASQCALQVKHKKYIG